MSYLPGAVYNYQTVTSTPTPISVANKIAYVCRGSGLLSFKLPASTIAGFSFRLIGKTCNWEIQQNANQSIVNGIITTNLGVTGNLSSTYITDTVEVTCLIANTDYQVTDSRGNLTTI